jgi:uncharacterized membrane protein
MKNEVDEGKVWAFISVLLGIVGFVMVILAKRENSYAMHYAKQGLVLSITSIIVWVGGFLPLIGLAISTLGSIAIFILWIIGLVYSLSGQKKNIPIIGEYGKKINI